MKAAAGQVAPPPDGEGRLSSLDIARSLAALAVVLWHWQHFQYSGYALRAGFDQGAQPEYALLFPFYEGGWFAVDFFFMLSGYIFFWKYQAGIGNGAFTAGKFFVLRFSRLYPLHLLTLALVAVLQALHVKTYGQFFVFPFNDLYHFVLQLFMASQWGLQRGASFNDPVWSLSIEVLLYALFFCIARYTSSRWALLAAIAAIGFTFYGANLSNALGRGLFCFFTGGMACYAMQAVIRARTRRALEPVLYGATLLAIVGCLLASRHGTTAAVAEGITAGAAWLHPGLAPLQAGMSDRLHRVANYLLATALLFPLLIASLVLLELRFHAKIRRLAFIGHISYSSYLLHVPLQIACALAFPAAFTTPAAAGSGRALAAFVAALVALSFASFYLFERPAQTFIRRLATSRRPIAVFPPAATGAAPVAAKPGN